MSSSIAIPKRKKKMNELGHAATPESSSSSSSASSFAFGRFGGTPQSQSEARAPEVGSPSTGYQRERRPSSYLSSSLSKTEHTVINIGNSENPRLITCVKASQGFDWNQEIFLPSYVDYASDDLERKPDPVEDIIVTDEEIALMFPQ